jgi:uncharacterized RDD family membrane protein YckC
MDGQNDVSSPSVSGALCANHPASPAVATCYRCGTYVCVACYTVGADGRYYCYPCDSRVPSLAERGDRFVAHLVDNLIIFAPYIAAVVLGGILSAIIKDKDGVAMGAFSCMGALGTLGMAGYQLYLVSQTGQTIGKRMKGIRVVRMDGSIASLGRILLLRNFLPGCIGSLCGLFSLTDALFIFGDERRCLHDMIADTKVIKVLTDTGR